jgi:hypothetical protein
VQSIEIDLYIIGEKFKQARELQSLSLESLAQKACCSVQQIEQIEQGGKSAFYTEAQKLRTAKKVATILGLNEEQAFLGTAPKLKSALDLDGFQKNDENIKSRSLNLSGSLGLTLLLSLLGGYGIYEYISPDHNLYSMTSMPKSPIKPTVTLPTEKNNQSELKDQAVVAQTNDPCLIQDQNSSTFIPTSANFAGNFVVFISKTVQTVCVVDGTGKSQKVEIVPGQNTVVIGVGPYKILGERLKEVDTYYQGWKVMNIALNAQSIVLKEVQIQTRTEPAKTVVLSQSSESKDLESTAGSILPAAKLNTYMDNSSHAVVSDAKLTSSTVNSNED